MVEELKKIYDPEIPVNIYELGLIYDINCAKESDGIRCVVTMTLTSAACPVSESLVEQVRNIGFLIDDVPELIVDPHLVFDPPWSQEKMSDEARLQLDMF
ncbi:iron-sulfur cluster assembly protein [Pontiellaceae bacterium B1224]|nr:iron-sulfur cluster assembly protein [Pontiellaceae bacterium B1224]